MNVPLDTPARATLRRMFNASADHSLIASAPTRTRREAGDTLAREVLQTLTDIADCFDEAMAQGRTSVGVSIGLCRKARMALVSQQLADEDERAKVTP